MTIKELIISLLRAPDINAELIVEVKDNEGNYQKVNNWIIDINKKKTTHDFWAEIDKRNNG